MTMEKTLTMQTVEEHSAMREPDPHTDEIIIRSENGYESKTEAVSVLFENTPEVNQAGALLSSVEELDGWIHFKVKNELVTQIYTGLKASDFVPGDEQNQINITAVAELVKKELEVQKQRHEHTSQELENNVIPLARTRSEARFHIKESIPYWQKDVDNLYDRAEVHERMGEYIGVFLQGDEDTLRTTVEQYIEGAHAEARAEVVSILQSQISEFEARRRDDAQRIAELQTNLNHITGQQADVKDLVESSDLDLLVEEQKKLDIERLTGEAKKIAA